MEQSYKRVKLACYTTNVSMSIVSNLSPLLFLTFRELYGISYSLLGLLVLVNFCTQLAVDLYLSFFSYKVNMALAVKITPVLTVIGLTVFAISPWILPGAEYAGLVIGTVIFSASGGLAEVLISPVIAAIPAENPEHELSKLHSIYAWGVVAIVPIITLFLLAFGNGAWWWLSLMLAAVPLVASLLFFGARLPRLETPERASGVLALLKKRELWLSVLAIFLGGAAECTMAQWSSGYIEKALGIPKVWGDLCGVAVFYVALAAGRTLYAKYGKRIEKILLLGAIGATLCYLCAAISNIAIIGLIACAFTGFCVSMLWPGSLIVGSERVPTGGVFIFAMMAAGGDLGASVGPQLVGVITDAVAASESAVSYATSLGITPEQLGMKCGMLVGMLFPALAIAVYAYILKTRDKYHKLPEIKI